jgi:peptidoglycan hydrolase-like protein with peptidoglycan-binding domain
MCCVVAVFSKSRPTVAPPSGVGSTLGPAGSPRRRLRARYVLPAAVLVVVIATGAFTGVVLAQKAKVTASPVALAGVSLPIGAGKIERVTVVGGRQAKTIPVELRGDEIWPTVKLPVGDPLTVEVVLRRPGWIAWLTGKTEQIQLSLTTPATHLRSHFLTLKRSSPLQLSFKQPVQLVEYGERGSVTRRTLASGQTEVDLPHTGSAGSMLIAAAPRVWESPKLSRIDWFPAGAAATAVATPSPGTTISPNTPIRLTFSKPVTKALDGHMPPVSPRTAGTWQPVNRHTIVFRPQGYGYGLGAHVTIDLPAGVELVDGTSSGSDPKGTWSVPPGSTLRLQQMLSMLGYLPFKFQYSGTPVASTLAAEEEAAVKPPTGTFQWAYPHVPSQLRSMWEPGASGVMTRGAVMAFENDHDMTPDGVAGPTVWKALISDVLSGHGSKFGYTFVSVSEESDPESLDLWHNGHTVLTTPVNTGIAAAPTAQGVFPVYEHLVSTTMSGLNPDGTPYSDPGVPWVSYFNGGDALHGFPRGGYGWPQSLGCVEMPIPTAGQVFPYTPIGTLVDVS